MMRNTITRTMATSTINAFRLDVVDGQPKVTNLEPVVVTGKASEKYAKKELIKLYGKEASITIASIDVSEDVYEISVEDFMKHAKKVDKTSEVSEETIEDVKVEN